VATGARHGAQGESFEHPMVRVGCVGCLTTALAVCRRRRGRKGGAPLVSSGAPAGSSSQGYSQAKVCHRRTIGAGPAVPGPLQAPFLVVERCSSLGWKPVQGW